MMRDEAIAKAAFCELRDAGTRGSWANKQIAENFVTMASALGLLKLEEPKSAHDRMMEACRRRDLTGPTIDRFCEALDLAGLRIVEK